MIGITKFVLKRPVTTLLVILSLVFFGVMSIVDSKLELTPEIDMPILVVTTVYAGASPEDIDELVTTEIEDSIGTLSGVDTMTSMSSENYSLIMLQYDYGTDIDNAYSELRKKLDSVQSDLPDDAEEPNILEFDISEMASMYVTVKNSGVNNIYNYTEKNIVPELEKISAVASTDIYGGREEYISVKLDSEKLSQLGLDISTVAQLVGSASFTIPAGSTSVGNTDMSVSMETRYSTPEELERIPITYGNGNIIYLEDIATVSRAEDEATSLGRYNGEDAIILAINQNQQYTANALSKEVHSTFDRLIAEDPNLEFSVVNDNADDINSSLSTMIQSIIAAVVISTIILLLFYGDVKGSLIVATSIPISTLAALIMMWAMGYSLNVVTLGSLVLAVGMMVDNSIVVLESCFRAMEEERNTTREGYKKAALHGASMVASSVMGSTVTTCVVFLPLGFLSGLSGQFFQPLGMTIVFSMIASLISATAVVPLCYVFYKPVENEKAPAYYLIRAMQDGYRSLERVLMRHKKTTAVVAMVFFVGSVLLATQLKAVLMPDMDQGTVSVTIDLKPNLKMDEQDAICRRIEQMVMEDEDFDSYMLSSGSSMLTGGSASLTVYLKSDRKKTTDETVELWKRKFQELDDCDVTVESYSMMSSMSVASGYNLTLASADYDELKEASDIIYEGMKTDSRLTNVSSSLANAAPVIKFDIDPVQASAEGLVPAQVASSVYTMLSGSEVDKMTVDGESVEIRVEYPEDEFDDINKVKDILISTSTGGKVYLKDIANVRYEDSPATIERIDKEYVVTLSAGYTDLADKNTEQDVYDQYVVPVMTSNISERVDSQTEMMNEEFGSLGMALVIAVFLVFVVMAAQFESPVFSFMVMTTIPFAMVGSFGLLWLFDIEISMPSLIGFLMLIGTVVNNGILYVDTVNQLKEEMSLDDALVEAGAIRLRPILMTTFTTVFSMIPMALGTGEAGPMMQGLAMVNVGGLLTSTVMALLVLPIYYYFMSGGRKQKRGL